MTRVEDDPVGVDADPIRITVDGEAVTGRAGESVAAALLADGRACGVFCGIGACFGCRVTVNGSPETRACLHPAHDGDVVTTSSPDEVPRTPFAAKRWPPLPGGWDVLVVGAGPAGLNAALAAADGGAKVLLLDSNARGGGQYHRQLPLDFHARNPERAHHDQATAADLLSLVAAHPNITHEAGVTVWSASAGPHTLHLLRDGRTAGSVSAPTVILATGAFDRAVPFPGWDLPGVYTAGAAQALVKGQRVRPGRRMLVGGTGPFLLPVAAGLAEAGVELAGVYEANRITGAWLRRPAVLASAPGKLAEAVRYNATLARHGARVSYGRAIVAVHGTDTVEAATVAKLDRNWGVVAGSERTVEVDAVAVGYGFTPQLELALALGCAVDGFVLIDAAQRTSVEGVYAAGELTGIGGAVLSAAEGRLAGLAAAGEPPDAATTRTRESTRRFAEALAAVYPVKPGWRGWLTADTTVCRCERVPYDTIRRALDDDAVSGLKTLKLCTRAGLGWCQGRVCGRNLADLAHLEPSDHRPIAAPLLLGDLALPPQENS